VAASAPSSPARVRLPGRVALAAAAPCGAQNPAARAGRGAPNLAAVAQAPAAAERAARCPAEVAFAGGAWPAVPGRVRRFERRGQTATKASCLARSRRSAAAHAARSGLSAERYGRHAACPSWRRRGGRSGSIFPEACRTPACLRQGRRARALLVRRPRLRPDGPHAPAGRHARRRPAAQPLCLGRRCVLARESSSLGQFPLTDGFFANHASSGGLLTARFLAFTGSLHTNRLGNRIGESGPALLRPVVELAVGEAGEPEPDVGVDPQERSTAAEVTEGPG
jgi:hypothetical protein